MDNKDNTDRSFLYGRLFWPRKICGSTKKGVEISHLMSNFSADPFRVWKHIEERILLLAIETSPHKELINEELENIMYLFNEVDFSMLKPLQADYTLGMYYEDKMLRDLIKELKDNK